VCGEAAAICVTLSKETHSAGNSFWARARTSVLFPDCRGPLTHTTGLFPSAKRLLAASFLGVSSMATPRMLRSTSKCVLPKIERQDLFLQNGTVP